MQDLNIYVDIFLLGNQLIKTPMPNKQCVQLKHRASYIVQIVRHGVKNIESSSIDHMNDIFSYDQFETATFGIYIATPLII